MEKIKNIYDFLLKEPFPDKPKNDRLLEFYGELVYLDSVYMGLAQKIINGDHERIDNINDIQGYLEDMSKLEGIPQGDVEAVARMKYRGGYLNNLAFELKQLTNK